MLYLTSAFLMLSIIIPIWRIELDAPQYPEGLTLLIYSYKLGGNVDIINGLNHYIGMATLHAENFIEFTVLPYLIGFYALLFIVTALLGTKRGLYIAFSAFVVFGIVAMIDFYRWEYEYGHNLDPNAAIIVPGMAYQPPLIGFKQLLNFGAYSIPDLGGWLFVSGGLLLLMAVLNETGFLDRFRKNKSKAKVTAAILLLSFISSCGPKGPQPIKLNKDECDYCKMTITDNRFGAEMITDKGRVYKFDDLSCMINDVNSKPKSIRSYYVHCFVDPGKFIDAPTAVYVMDQSIKSPMGGNTAAFTNPSSAKQFADSIHQKTMNWNQVLAIYK